MQISAVAAPAIKKLNQRFPGCILKFYKFVVFLVSRLPWWLYILSLFSAGFVCIQELWIKLWMRKG